MTRKPCRTPIQQAKNTAVALASAAALLCAAPVAWGQVADKSFADMVKRVALIPPGEHASDMLAKAAVAVKFIQQVELPQAHKAINEALQLDARNSYLHFLNGFVYHLQALQGDTQKNELAVEGYQQALRIDPGNWIAQEFLGLAHMDLKNFEQARAQFSSVLLMSPDSTVSIYGMMVSSYLLGDAVTACAMADQFRRTSAETSTETSPGFVRSSVAVYASCGNFETAELMRAESVKLSGSAVDAQRLGQRLAQWKSFYRQAKLSNGPAASVMAPELTPASLSSPMGQLALDPAPDYKDERYAQAFQPVSPKVQPAAQRARQVVEAPAPVAESPESSATATATPAATPAAAVAAAPSVASDVPRMVLVDVVMLSTQELIGSSKGVNLLSALSLQLGSASQPAYSRLTTSETLNGAAATVSTAITRAVTIPALAYSLNIVNANSSLNEVLARPTLAAMEGMPSEFFSGTNLSAGVVSLSSQGGTTIVPLDKRFGIKLAITPAFLPNDMIKLKVEAQRTALSASADNPKVAYQIEIAETSANANVVMQLGDTLVLSGLSEKSSSTTRDGVPVLQDIPVVQYLFSSSKTSDIQRSVLILITPRQPIYTSKVARIADAAASDGMKSWREQFGLAGQTPSNVESILNRLKQQDLFREFRQGDVTMERWDRMRTTGDRLREALGFLYF